MCVYVGNVPNDTSISKLVLQINSTQLRQSIQVCESDPPFTYLMCKSLVKWRRKYIQHLKSVLQERTYV